MRQEEHNIQVACVRWFNLQYPQYRGLLFSVPNGGARNLVTAAKLKAEGVVAGVADLLLLVPKFTRHYITSGDAYVGVTIHGLAIEMKTPKGRQSPEQWAWQQRLEAHGYKYAVCRSLDDFIATVEGYLNQSGESPRPVESHD